MRSQSQSQSQGQCAKIIILVKFWMHMARLTQSILVQKGNMKYVYRTKPNLMVILFQDWTTILAFGGWFGYIPILMVKMVNLQLPFDYSNVIVEFHILTMYCLWLFKFHFLWWLFCTFPFYYVGHRQAFYSMNYLNNFYEIFFSFNLWKIGNINSS